MGDHQQAQSTNFKEAFSLFDKRGNGRVQLDSLGDLLRACGQNPTLAEIKDLEHQAGGDCKCFSSHLLPLFPPVHLPLPPSLPLHTVYRPFHTHPSQTPANQSNKKKKKETNPPRLTSRLRRLLQDPEPTRRLPRPRRTRRLLPGLPSLRQGPHRLHRRGPIPLYPDEPGGEDER